jgi:isoleucyl-tRNA synthetase
MSDRQGQAGTTGADGASSSADDDKATQQTVRVTPGAGHQKVEPWFDMPALEREILELWDETKAFDTLVEQNAGNETFAFLDGPITANNPMGVHHAWGRTLKDAYQRYYAMLGRDQRYQNGFDCQGLWVEVEVEKELGFASKREVKEFGIDRFVETCKERVRKYSAVQRDQSIRLGQWMHWDDSYFTMADENNYTIWSFLKKCHQRGKIYRGSDVMPWSGRSGSAYSQMEVIEGRKLVTHTALFLRFPLRGRDKENLLIWTTTPWTLTSNVAAAVNVELDYVKLRENRSGELYYFAAENLEFQRLERQFKEKKEWIDGVPKLKTLAQIFNERGGYTIEGKIKGAELVGLEYDGPFDELDAQSIVGGFPFTDEKLELCGKTAHRVIDGGRDERGSAVVVAGEGTGIVHSAPGCGDIDHVLGKRLGLPAIAPLNEAAEFLPEFGFLEGKRAIDEDTVELILKNLKDKGLLVATEQYPHVYPHCWRTGDQLVFRLVDEWYINMDWRDEIKKVVDDIQWIPSWGHERELEWLTNMRDWMISKKRFWGLALPVWVCESCDSFDVIGSYDELKERAIEGWEQANIRPPIPGNVAPDKDLPGNSPHRPHVDQIVIACPECGGKAHRVEDVGNPWLDAGIVPYSTVRYGADQDYWNKWSPAELVLESFPGQFRNWFYALLAMSTMMEGVAPFKTLLGYALVYDENGKPMSKTKGNAIWFEDAADQAGADVMRWLYVSQDITANLNFGFKALREVRGKFINTLWNTYSFYTNYARLADFTPAGAPEVPFAERPDFDRWILTELQQTVTTCREAIERWDMRSAARAIEGFVDDLSGWYVRHNRRRFWKSGDDKDLQLALWTLYQCVYGVTRLTAPMIPFVTEAMYQNLVRGVSADAPTSLHHTPYPEADDALVDEAIADEMRAIMRLNSLALSAREAKKIKVRQPLSELRVAPADELEQRAAKRFRAMLADDLNVKQVVVLEIGAESPLSYSLKPNFKTLGSKLGKQMKPTAKAIGAASGELLAGYRRGDDTFSVTLDDGETVELQRDDLLLSSTAPEGQTVAEDRGTWVAFDTEITEELEIEGLMRDLMRRLQVQRKEIGLEIEDRIALRWQSEGDKLQKVFAAWGETLQKELLCTAFEQETALDAGAEGVAKVKLAGETVLVHIERTRNRRRRPMAEDKTQTAELPPVDAELLEILRCPVAVQKAAEGEDKGKLELHADCWLVCDDSGLKYPIKDGIPVMLVEEGEKWKETAVADLPVPPPEK